MPPTPPPPEKQRLPEEDVRSIFSCFQEPGRYPPPHLKFQIVPGHPSGQQLSPPPYEFKVGLYILLRPSKTKKKKGGAPLDIEDAAARAHEAAEEKVPPHLRCFIKLPPQTQHSNEGGQDLAVKRVHWGLSGPQKPQNTPSTRFQQRYCYPKFGSEGYAEMTGGALWTKVNQSGKDDDEYRLLHVYFSSKRASNKHPSSSKSKLVTKASSSLSKHKLSTSPHEKRGQLPCGVRRPTPVQGPHQYPPTLHPRPFLPHPAAGGYTPMPSFASSYHPYPHHHGPGAPFPPIPYHPGLPPHRTQMPLMPCSSAPSHHGHRSNGGQNWRAYDQVKPPHIHSLSEFPQKRNGNSFSSESILGRPDNEPKGTHQAGNADEVSVETASADNRKGRDPPTRISVASNAGASLDAGSSSPSRPIGHRCYSPFSNASLGSATFGDFDLEPFSARSSPAQHMQEVTSPNLAHTEIEPPTSSFHGPVSASPVTSRKTGNKFVAPSINFGRIVSNTDAMDREESAKTSRRGLDDHSDTEAETSSESEAEPGNERSPVDSNHGGGERGLADFAYHGSPILAGLCPQHSFDDTFFNHQDNTLFREPSSNHHDAAEDDGELHLDDKVHQAGITSDQLQKLGDLGLKIGYQ